MRSDSTVHSAENTTPHCFFFFPFFFSPFFSLFSLFLSCFIFSLLFLSLFFFLLFFLLFPFFSHLFSPHFPTFCLRQHVQYGRTRTTCKQLSAMQQQSSSQRVGALLIPPPCLGGLTHRWVLVDDPQYTRCPKGISVNGRGHSSAQQYSCRNTPNIVAERWQQEALVTRVCWVVTDPETSVLLGCLFEQ